MRDPSIVFAGLMPHAPVLAPGVDGVHFPLIRKTAWAMEEVAAHMVAARPDTVVVISPHSPRRSGAFGIWRTAELRGSLERFGSSESRIALPLDRALAERLREEVRFLGWDTWDITQGELDHGAVVPLLYLTAAGWTGPTLVVSLNGPGEAGLEELGRALSSAAQGLGRHLALIASGDMSHRLSHASPSGYHPEAGLFDKTFIGFLRSEEPERVGRIDPELLGHAAEDVVDPTRVALAATGRLSHGHRVLSYEGPFGVGYAVAILFESSELPLSVAAPKAAPEAHSALPELSRPEDLPKLARLAITSHLGGRGPSLPLFRAGGELAQRHGVFVTLETEDGELKGCRGTPVPTENNLVLETWHNAISAAFFDGRFPPVGPEDLPHLRISVTLLGPLEAVASLDELDPRRFGILLRSSEGRKGLLLPDLDGISTVHEQLRITRLKAGIEANEPVKVQRFTARRYSEEREG